MMTSQDILAEISAAAKRLNIAPTTLCQRAVKNAKLPARLARGETITLATLNALRAYIGQCDAEAPQPEAAE